VAPTTAMIFLAMAASAEFPDCSFNAKRIPKKTSMSDLLAAPKSRRFLVLH